MPRKADPADPLQLERFLPYRLSVLANTVSAALATTYAGPHGLSTPEWRVIAVLAHEPGLSAAEVAERTAMDKVAVSRAVARLLRRDRIRRQRADVDRRRSRLELSPAGLAVYREVSPRALHYEARLLAGLTPAEARLLDSALDRLLAGARAMAPDV